VNWESEKARLKAEEDERRRLEMEMLKNAPVEAPAFKAVGKYKPVKGDKTDELMAQYIN